MSDTTVKFKIPTFWVLRDSGFLKANEVVYDFIHWDYGLASDDTRYTGVPHTSVTRSPDGKGTPSLTVPFRDLFKI